MDAVKKQVAEKDGVQILSLARPAMDVGTDMVLYLVSEKRLPLSYRN
jgi:hypothetical protein